MKADPEPEEYLNNKSEFPHPNLVLSVPETE